MFSHHGCAGLFALSVWLYTRLKLLTSYAPFGSETCMALSYTAQNGEG
jgi:hypothetical protein